MPRTTVIGGTGVALLLCGALTSSGARAAEDEAPGRTALGDAVEIVVSATLRKADRFDVPGSTSVVGADEIGLVRARRTLTDALLDLPSTMVQKTAYGQASPFVRGFTGYQTVMLVDGVRLNNSVFRSGPNQYWATVDPFTVERLEVVRGASSVLHGSDAVGGAVNAVARRRRTFEPGGHATARIHTRWASAEHSRTVRTEVRANQGDVGVLAGATYRSYGDLDAGGSTRRQPETGYRDTDGDLRLDWLQGDDTVWTFAVQHVDQDDVPRTHKTVHAVPFRGSDVGGELRRELSQTRDLAYLRMDTEGLDSPLADRLVATVSWHRQREKRVRDRDTVRTDVQGIDVRTLGLRAQLERDTPAGDWTYGFEVWHDDVESFRNDYRNGVLDLARVQGAVADDATYDTLAAFVQNEFDAGPARVTAGARLTHARADAGRVDNPEVGGADPATPGNVIDVDGSWTNLVGSLRATHPLGEDWLLFGGVSQAFRAPNLSDLTRLDATSGFENPSPGLDPEEFVSFEIGARTRQDGWSFQAAFWHTHIDDLIVASPTGRVVGGTPEVRKDNVGDGWVHGVELEGTVELGEGWTLSGAATWMDGEVDQLDPASNKVRRPASRLMPLTGTATLAWRTPSGAWQAWASGRAATRQDELSLKDETDTSRIPEGGTPRYAVLNVGASARLSEFARLSAVLENVFGANYRIHGSGVNEPGRNLVLALDLEF